MSGYEHWKQPKQVKQQMHLLASDLRQRSTKSEALLWEQLRNRKLNGRKFRRQVPIGAYVVDFFCADEQLVIEVDGSIHVQQRDADQLRQETIKSLGIRFLRFSALQVESNMSDVLQAVRQSFME